MNALEYQIILFLAQTEKIVEERPEVDLCSAANDISYQDLRISIRCMINTLLMLISALLISILFSLDLPPTGRLNQVLLLCLSSH